mmetsp:Transcript_16328/g.25357  ORF Transcript_16328/g.25357 Transcript_16328/m.25357 type:complete len:321 (+) Transcript_16328:1403-2365(+)
MYFFLRPNIDFNLQNAKVHCFGNISYSNSITERKRNKISIGCLKMVQPNNIENYKTLKLPINTSDDEVISNLQKCLNKNEIMNFCSINRELLSYSILSRLTSLKLKSQQDSFANEQTGKIELIIKNIIKANSCNDRSNTQAMIQSEKLIKKFLDQPINSVTDEPELKSSKIKTTWFWIILSSALISWEEKLKQFENKDDNKTYKNLLEIKKIFMEDNSVLLNLPNEIVYLENQIFKSFIPIKKQQSTLEYVNGVKLLISQLEMLPSTSYGPILKKINLIYCDLLQNQYGIELKKPNLSQVRFVPEELSTESKLVEIKLRE